MDIAADARERIIDEEHLRLLAIGYYIAGGLTIALVSIFLLHFAVALVAASHPELFPASAFVHGVSAEAIFRLMAWGLGLMILLGWTFGALTIYAGRCIKARKRRIYTLVLGTLNLAAMPVGTLVGIGAVLVLSRPTVKALYAA